MSIETPDEFIQALENMMEPPVFPELPTPELADLVDEDGELVRFISVRTLVGMTEAVKQILERIGDLSDPSVQGQLELIQILRSDYLDMTEHDPNFV